jgi:hypothetical protein
MASACSVTTCPVLIGCIQLQLPTETPALTDALLLARSAIINWLVREAGSSASLLTADPYPKQSVSQPELRAR